MQLGLAGTIYFMFVQGLRSWDVDSTHVDLSCELLNLANAAPEGDEARNGEKLVQWASENLVVEVLIHCQVNTLLQCMKNLLSSFTRHRHIIHAGYTFQGTGSWILQDGTFSFTDFVELWEEPEVTRILGAYRGDISVSMHCAEEYGWTDDRLGRESFTKLCQVRMNPPELLLAHSSGIITFVDYISKLTAPATLKEILEPSEIVGNIRFSRPTLYVFPGGQGDAALFGVNGFNMLIDGGFSRRSCFWDFTRHLDRLDAVLLTRVNNNAVGGLDSVLDRKRQNQVYPQIGHFFGNVMERKHPEMEKSGESGELLVSLTETGQRMLDNLRSINIRPQHCFRDHSIEPINLYHKVGHGKLDMYVLNPAKDSREVREFMSKWNTDCKSFVQARMSVKVEGKEMNYPVLNLVSICALLVWQPDNPRDPITRILFPGSTPQQKIFEALGKLKHLEFLKYPVCSAKTIAASHKSRVKSEKIVSEAKSQFSTSGIVKDKSGNGEAITRTTVPRAPSESRVSSKYSSVRSKISSSARSDSSSTIQTITGDTTGSEKEHKGRERSREKRKVTSTAKSVDRDVKDRDNKSVESEVKKTERVSSSRRVDTGLSKTSSSAKVSSTTSKVSSKVTSRIDSGKKSGQVSGVTSPPSKDLKKEAGDTSSISKTAVASKSSGILSSKYGIGVTRTVISKASAGSTASPPPTPPKSAKEATNRKVIEHKTQSTRKSLIDSSKSKDKVQAVEIKQKATSVTKSSVSAKSTIPRPPTASTTKKTVAAPANEPVAVKRPSTAGSRAAAAAAGTIAALSATGIAVAAALTSSTDEHNGTNGHGETIEKDSGDGDIVDETAKSPVEIEIVDRNGLALSVPVTESSSELSSLEHVSVTDDMEETGATGSEEIITELYKDQIETAGEIQSETHTITEPGGDNYDEEDEYLIIEKDESAGAEEINIDSNITAQDNGKHIFAKEDDHPQEKEVDEEKYVEELGEDIKESVESKPADENIESENEEAGDKTKESVDEIKESVDKESEEEKHKHVDEVDEAVVEKQNVYKDEQEASDEVPKSSEIHSEEEMPEPEKSRKEEISDFLETDIEMTSEETVVTEHKISEPEKEASGLREIEISGQLGDRLSEEREEIHPPEKPILDEQDEPDPELPDDEGIPAEKQIIPESGDLTESPETTEDNVKEKEDIGFNSEPKLEQDNKNEDKKLEELEPTEIGDLTKSLVSEEPLLSKTVVKEQQEAPISSNDEELPKTPQHSFDVEEIATKPLDLQMSKAPEVGVSSESVDKIESMKPSISQEQIQDADVCKDADQTQQSAEEIVTEASLGAGELKASISTKEIKSAVSQESEIEVSNVDEIAAADDDKIVGEITEIQSKIETEGQEEPSGLAISGNEENAEIVEGFTKSSESFTTKSISEIDIEEPASKLDDKVEELQEQDSVVPQEVSKVQEEETDLLKSELREKSDHSISDDKILSKETEEPDKEDKKLEDPKDNLATELVEESIESKTEIEEPTTCISTDGIESQPEILEDLHISEAKIHTRVKRSLPEHTESPSQESAESLSHENLSSEKPEMPLIPKSASEIKEQMKLDIVSDVYVEDVQDSDINESVDLVKEQFEKSEENLPNLPSPHEMKASVECVTLKDMDTEKESKSEKVSKTDEASEKQDLKSEDSKESAYLGPDITEIESVIEAVVSKTSVDKSVKISETEEASEKEVLKSEYAKKSEIEDGGANEVQEAVSLGPDTTETVVESIDSKISVDKYEKASKTDEASEKQDLKSEDSKESACLGPDITEIESVIEAVVSKTSVDKSVKISETEEASEKEVLKSEYAKKSEIEDGGANEVQEAVSLGPDTTETVVESIDSKISVDKYEKASKTEEASEKGELKSEDAKESEIEDIGTTKVQEAVSLEPDATETVVEAIDSKTSVDKSEKAFKTEGASDKQDLKSKDAKESEIEDIGTTKVQEADSLEPDTTEIESDVESFVSKTSVDKPEKVSKIETAAENQYLKSKDVKESEIEDGGANKMQEGVSLEPDATEVETVVESIDSETIVDGSQSQAEIHGKVESELLENLDTVRKASLVGEVLVDTDFHNIEAESEHSQDSLNLKHSDGQEIHESHEVVKESETEISKSPEAPIQVESALSDTEGTAASKDTNLTELVVASLDKSEIQGTTDTDKTNKSTEISEETQPPKQDKDSELEDNNSKKVSDHSETVLKSSSSGLDSVGILESLAQSSSVLSGKVHSSEVSQSIEPLVVEAEKSLSTVIGSNEEEHTDEIEVRSSREEIKETEKQPSVEGKIDLPESEKQETLEESQASAKILISDTLDKQTVTSEFNKSQEASQSEIQQQIEETIPTAEEELILTKNAEEVNIETEKGVEKVPQESTVEEVLEVKGISIESRIESMRKEEGRGWIETETEVPEETAEEIDIIEKDIAEAGKQGEVEGQQEVPTDKDTDIGKASGRADRTSKEIDPKTVEWESSQKSEFDESCKFDISVKLDETRSDSAKETSPDSLRTDELDLALEQHRRRLSAANEESIKSKIGGEETSQDEIMLTDEGKDHGDIETSRESQFGSLNEDDQHTDDLPIGDEVENQLEEDARTPIQIPQELVASTTTKAQNMGLDIPPVPVSKQIELIDEIELPVEVIQNASGTTDTVIISKPDTELGGKLIGEITPGEGLNGKKMSIGSVEAVEELPTADKNKQVAEVETDRKKIETESNKNQTLPVTTTEPPTKSIEPPVSVKPQITETTGEIKETSSKPPVPVPSAIPHKIPRESREVIRTPDEVADLPVHEEVEPGTYETDFFHERGQEKDVEEDELTSDLGDQMDKSSGVIAEPEEKIEDIVSATATVPGTTTGTGTTFTSSVTHTTKDEESPAPASDDFRMSHADKVTTEEKVGSKTSDVVDKSVEKVEEEEIPVGHSLPAGLVEKIDAAVSPVLESLLTKSVEKTLEKSEMESAKALGNNEICKEDEAELPGESTGEEIGSSISPGKSRQSDRVESDKYSTTSQLLEKVESGAMQTKGYEQEMTSKSPDLGDKSLDAPEKIPGSCEEEKTEQIEQKRDEGLKSEIELEEPQTDSKESIPFVQKGTAITSVVITPSTPPVQLTDEGASLFPLPPLNSGGNATPEEKVTVTHDITGEDDAASEGRLTPEDKQLSSDEKFVSDGRMTPDEKRPSEMKLTSEDQVTSEEVVTKTETFGSETVVSQSKDAKEFNATNKLDSFKPESDIISGESADEILTDESKTTVTLIDVDKSHSSSLITTTGSTLLVEETKTSTSEESSSSSALTAIVETSKENISSVTKTDADESDRVSVSKSPLVVEIIEEKREKLFFLPRDDDDDEDNEDEGVEDDDNNDNESTVGLGAVEAGLLNAANTLNAPVVHQSMEDIATIPSPERQRSPEGSVSTQKSEEVIKREKPLEKSDLESKTAVESEKLKPKNVEDIALETEHISPKVDADKSKFLAYSEDDAENKLGILKPDDHKVPGSEDEMEFAGKSLVSAIAETITSSTGVILSVMGQGQAEIFAKSQEDKSPKVVFSDTTVQEISAKSQDSEEPISETLIETAQSAVSSALESATETIQVAESTVDEVQKSAQEALDNLEDSDLMNKASEEIEKIVQQSQASGLQIEESFTAQTSKLQECTKSVEHVADKICDSMRNIRREGDCTHESDDDDRPEVVEELCIKTVLPPRIIDDVKDFGKKSPEEIIKSSMKIIHHETPDDNQDSNVEKANLSIPARTAEDVMADLEDQMLSETFGFVVDTKAVQQAESLATRTENISFVKDTSGDPGQIKSPVIDTEEPNLEEVKSSVDDNSVSQQIEAEPKERTQRKRKELTDYIGTIKEAKAVFDTLLNIAKSGAALSSAVEECKENAVDAIRRHLEEANEVYRPVKREPVVPDSPEEEQHGMTIYESLEQMALAGSELFTGLVEKIEKDIEEKAKREETHTPDPETPDQAQRRLSAELAVNAALQHLHETFKTMQTMGSPKRSSFHAATCKRHLKVCTGDHQDDEDDIKSASSGRFSQSAMTSSLNLSTSASLAESTVKSPDDEYERSEGETMRESIASFTSGVGSETDDRAEFMGTSVTESVTFPQESDTEKVGSPGEGIPGSASSFTSKFFESQIKDEEIQEEQEQERISEESAQECSSSKQSQSSVLTSSRKTSCEESKNESISSKIEVSSTNMTKEQEQTFSSKSATDSSSVSTYELTKDAKMSSASEFVELGKSHISSFQQKILSSSGESSNKTEASSMSFEESSKKSSTAVSGSEDPLEDVREDSRKTVYYEEKCGEEPSLLKSSVTTTTTTSTSPGGTVSKSSTSRRFSSSGEPLDETADGPSVSKFTRRSSEAQGSQLGAAGGVHLSNLFGASEKHPVIEQKKGEDSGEFDPRPLSDFGYQTRESGDEESGSYHSVHGYSTMIAGSHCDSGNQLETSTSQRNVVEEISGDASSATTIRTVTETSSDIPEGFQKSTTVRTVTEPGFETLSEFQKSTLASSYLPGFEKSTIVRTVTESSSDSIPTFERSTIIQREIEESGDLSDLQRSTIVRTITQESSSDLSGLEKSTIIKNVSEDSKALPGFEKSTILRTISEDSSGLTGFQKSTTVRTVTEKSNSSELPSFERSTILRTVSEDSSALPGSEKSTTVRTISEGFRSFPDFDKSSNIHTTTSTGGEDISEISKSTIHTSTSSSQQQYYPAFPQDILEEEAYSSGDFSDSQLSSVQTGHVETDDEVHNFEQSSAKVDLDNGNYSSTTVVTSDNGSVTTQTSVTSVNTGENGNTVTQTTRVVTTSRNVGDDPVLTSSTTSETQEASGTSTSAHSDILKEWGKPLGLPVVYTEGAEGGSNGPDSGNFGGKATPKKNPGGSKGPGTPAKSASGSSRDKRSSSRKSRHSPIYVDLAYVPHHGNSHYCDSEFFRMIRGRYYVFSGLEPSREVFEGLLEGKQQWEDKNLETTVIPTYDTDTLGYWVGDSEKELAEAKIDLAPSASRCTINLQDHETSCAAYRLEF